MTNEPDTGFRLSIWRPARLGGPHLQIAGNGNGSERSSLLDAGTVLEQIYAWDPGPCDPGANSSSNAKERLDELLLRPFGAHRPPAERRVDCFVRAVLALLDDPAVQQETFWSDCEETVPTDGSELNLRVNAAMGVLRHFLWVARVYADLPDASVLLR